MIAKRVCFQYAILIRIVLHIAFKYILHTLDLRNAHPWENKAVYLLYTELVIGEPRPVIKKAANEKPVAIFASQANFTCSKLKDSPEKQRYRQNRRSPIDIPFGFVFSLVRSPEGLRFLAFIRDTGLSVIHRVLKS